MIVHGFSVFLSDLCYWVLGDDDEMFEEAIYILHGGLAVNGENKQGKVLIKQEYLKKEAKESLARSI